MMMMTMRTFTTTFLCSLLATPVLSWHISAPSLMRSQTTSPPRRAEASRVHSSTQQEQSSSSQKSDSFIHSAFSPTECDNTNRPPSLNILLRTLQQLTTGSDIRGRFVEHARLGSIASVAHEIGRVPTGSQPPLTPLAAYCLGHGLASQLVDLFGDDEPDEIRIALGRDPRTHGTRLADALARGAESFDSRIHVVYTDLATTPACSAFVKFHNCHSSVMVTASHLPPDRNGFKIFIRDQAQPDLVDLGSRAAACANEWYTRGILPPSSGSAVMCTSHVSYMPAYTESLKQAVRRETGVQDKPLQGLTVVLNAGNGAGGFFQQVLQDLGADCHGSIHLEPDGNFPNEVPNPEYAPMLATTVKACETVQADLGIMLDTDADRCGFVVPRLGADGKVSQYEALNRNRLIALLGVLFAKTHPGCAMVTDSVTSEGLATFLEDKLGLAHVRYLKGYMNVINKAKELTDAGTHDAQVAIETSGHCAMQENDYLDDGTYTAVKVVSLLASLQGQQSLLDLIADLDELDEITELRMSLDSLDQVPEVFDFCALQMEQSGRDDWEIDTDNLEGVRIRTGDNQFLMLRKSLHDPIISLQIEATSRERARETMVQPLLELLRREERIRDAMDLSVLENY